MADYDERSYTPLDKILGMHGVTNEQRAELLGEGCLYVEAEIVTMLDALETTALKVLADIRTARTRIVVGDRQGDDMTYPVDEIIGRMHSQSFRLSYNDLDLTRFQIHANKAVDAMSPDLKARFTRKYPSDSQNELEA